MYYLLGMCVGFSFGVIFGRKVHKREIELLEQGIAAFESNDISMRRSRLERPELEKLVVFNSHGDLKENEFVKDDEPFISLIDHRRFVEEVNKKVDYYFGLEVKYLKDMPVKDAINQAIEKLKD